ncbi:MAG: DUF3667 domain-containing protein [Cyclobacteriaceae bacterium]|jgi:hypothetical protein|nr:DUF3667 domain-containing protein [Cyclobacteriaceae bacterium]
MRHFFRKRIHLFDYEQTRTCLSCGNAFSGKFCSRCGEKVVEPYDRSIRSFVDNFINALTFIDGKFFRSFKTMLLRPGQMARDIAVGKRQPYMKPMAFFFVGNFIYFLFPLFQTFNTRLEVINRAGVREEVAAFVEASNMPMDEFVKTYNASSTNWAKVILVLLAPLMFPFLVIVNYSKKTFLADHFVFAMEYAAFIVFVPTILVSFFLTALIFLFRIFFDMDINTLFHDQNTLPFVSLLLLYFLVMGVRHFYHFPWWRVALSAVLLFGCQVVIITAYRFILFKITFWSVT